MSLVAVLAMTRGQIFDVIFWPRDKGGKAEFDDDDEATPLQRYTAAMVKAGVPYPEAIRRAGEYLRDAPNDGE